MRFVRILTKFGEPVAINVNSITSIRLGNDSVLIYTDGDKPIVTQFTDIEHAVDFVQRAPSVSLSEVA
ncbi:MAG TPA: hypothetical protein DCM40_13235 [Maribacter sp.]|nr:hypothetical protein [Maribacter sp.]